MQTSKIEEVCQILNEYNFKFDDVNFLCVLCSKLLIEARQAPCGCRFCKCCIEGFLKEGPVFCPNGLEECKEEVLQLNQNIAIDHATNRKILKLRVVCPVSSCTYEDELRNMGHHLIECGKVLVQCPFVTVGCFPLKSEKEELVKHLQADIYKHTELLLESIGNLKNDLTTTQAQFERPMKYQKDMDAGRHQSPGADWGTYKWFLNRIRKKIPPWQFQYVNYVPYSLVVLILGIIFCRILSHVDQLKHELEQLRGQVKQKHDEMDIFYRRNEYSGEYIWEIQNLSAVIKNMSYDSMIYSDYFYTNPNGYKMVLALYPSVLMRGTLRLEVEQQVGEYDKFLPANPHFLITVFVLDQQVWNLVGSQNWRTTEVPFKIWKSDPPVIIQNDSVIIKSLISTLSY